MTLTALATAEPEWNDSDKPFYLVPDVGTDPDDLEEIRRQVAQWFSMGTRLMGTLADINAQLQGTEIRQVQVLTERVDSQENDLKDLHEKLQVVGLEESES